MVGKILGYDVRNAFPDEPGPYHDGSVVDMTVSLEFLRTLRATRVKHTRLQIWNIREFQVTYGCCSCACSDGDPQGTLLVARACKVWCIAPVD